jgi:type III pantothenate kinase
MKECIDHCATLEFSHTIVSSVKWDKHELESIIPFPFLFFDHGIRLPIHNKYSTPHTLGLDRLAAVMGARAWGNHGPALAIDLGTCITYDVINAADEYLGGAISPGVSMRFEAMHRQTARLPLATLTKFPPPFIGEDTVSCLQSGVFFGVREELKGMIKAYAHIYPDLKVFICGGDAEYFESLTKDHIFVIPNLVLYGLERILTYNVDK